MDLRAARAALCAALVGAAGGLEVEEGQVRGGRYARPWGQPGAAKPQLCVYWAGLEERASHLRRRECRQEFVVHAWLAAPHGQPGVRQERLELLVMELRARLWAAQDGGSLAQVRDLQITAVAVDLEEDPQAERQLAWVACVLQVAFATVEAR